MNTRPLIVVSLVVLTLSWLTVPAQAASTVSYVTMYGNGGYVSGTSQSIWTGAQVTLSGTASSGVTLSLPDSSTGMTIYIAAPTGQSLATGTYTGAQRTAFRGANPGIDVYGDGRGCNTESGWFTVNSITTDSSSNVTSFSADYEADCEGSTAEATFGEIRYNVDASTVALVPIARTALFQSTMVGSATNKPTTLVNVSAAPITVSSASVTSGSSVFSVASNNCAQIPAGGSCQIGLTYSPTAAQSDSGTLTVTDNTANSYVVNLKGTGSAPPSPPPPTVTVSTPATTYVYGAAATVIVHLQGSAVGQSVTLVRTSGSRSAVVGTQEVDGSGNAVFTAVVTQLTTFTGEWGTGSVQQADSVTVHVRAKVGMSETGATKRVGAYWIIPLGHTFDTVATVNPGKQGECVSMAMQIHTATGWHNWGSLSCVGLNAGSHATGILRYTRNLHHVPMRFRATYGGDASSLGQTSPWLYAEYW